MIVKNRSTTPTVLFRYTFSTNPHQTIGLLHRTIPNQTIPYHTLPNFTTPPHTTEYFWEFCLPLPRGFIQLDSCDQNELFENLKIQNEEKIWGNRDKN